ncbi:MAG: hypothetical protein J6S60_07295 [Oscillospiraceae bacterium]|nr:hypothetical protein [Oscillospiraceae bacterium]
MAGGLADLDNGFPARKGSQEQQISAVYDYLVMLLENLRYILRNLSPENFNEKETLDWIGDKIQANHIVSNTIITNELYAEYGAIADLTVDELRTDYQKAARYLAGNTAALDFLYIHDEQIDFLTGTVHVEDDTPLTEQLHHRGRYFWWKDAEKTQMTSLEETPWPVTVYQYDELLKGTLRFEDYQPPGGGAVTKVPVFVLGAGYGNVHDPAKGRGFLRKGTNSFDVWLHNNAGEDRGLFIGEQYTDIVGLRKTTELDFSGWDDGSFTEEIDGGIAAAYEVDFDAQDRPVKITDGAGHETVVIWE